jgi:hypothetical protein
MEELLDAFGQPRDLILRLFYKYGIFSYEDYIAELKHLHDDPQRRKELTAMTVDVHLYLDAMAGYFDDDELLNPEKWELKNPEPA